MSALVKAALAAVTLRLVAAINPFKILSISSVASFR
jgi:hypothetical protein